MCIYFFYFDGPKVILTILFIIVQILQPDNSTVARQGGQSVDWFRIKNVHYDEQFAKLYFSIQRYKPLQFGVGSYLQSQSIKNDFPHDKWSVYFLNQAVHNFFKWQGIRKHNSVERVVLRSRPLFRVYGVKLQTKIVDFQQKQRNIDFMLYVCLHQNQFLNQHFPPNVWKNHMFLMVSFCGEQ